MVKAETFCSLGLELLCDLRRSFVYTNWESTKDARIITDMRCPLRRQASKAAVSVADCTPMTAIGFQGLTSSVPLPG
eukprot:3088652-Rhodomonas_salina.2